MFAAILLVSIGYNYSNYQEDKVTDIEKITYEKNNHISNFPQTYEEYNQKQFNNKIKLIAKSRGTLIG